MSKIKVTNIDWDTDNIDVDLPKSMDIPEMKEDSIADYLSDQIGWCVFSFKIKE